VAIEGGTAGGEQLATAMQVVDAVEGIECTSGGRLRCGRVRPGAVIPDDHR
jgi:hypothetical protein